MKNKLCFHAKDFLIRRGASEGRRLKIVHSEKVVFYLLQKVIAILNGALNGLFISYISTAKRKTHYLKENILNGLKNRRDFHRSHAKNFIKKYRIECYKSQ